jgi:Cu+-exporting ATPase
LLVKQNTEIPCDGTIVFNDSYINESLLTGESKHVFKQVGSTVYGGTINITNNIHIKALQTGNDMTMNRIKKLVEHAQINKTQLQTVTNLVCKWFVYIILAISLIDFITWLIIGYFNKSIIPSGFTFYTFALYLSVSVIVVACPCALGLATPIAIMIGTGKAMLKGILLKDGGDSIEKMSKIDTIVFDKTGTLTTGEMSVMEYYFHSEFKSNYSTIYSNIYALSNISKHPLSKCLNMYTKDYYNTNLIVSDEKIYLGKGVECIIDNIHCYLGSCDWLLSNENSNNRNLNEKINKWKNNGYSIVLYKYDNKIQAAFAISDTLRNDAYNVVKTLKDMNIDIWLLTGDNLISALKIADKIGIKNENVVADVLPESKAQVISNIQNSEQISQKNWFSYFSCFSFRTSYNRLKTRKKLVAMIGDGGNDSIALAQADISISMKSGCDLALSSSNIVLLKSDLFDIVKLKLMSNKIMKKIYINLVWALGYNIIGIPLAAGVFYPFHLNPIFAALTMSLSSLFVVFNSLMLKYQLDI